MKRTFKIIYLLFSFVFLAYLVLPAPDYPQPLSDSLRSTEPADVESTLRRGYYTDMEREEVMRHYVDELDESPFLGITFPTYRLNYPPEEAQTIIRDQTRSTFLEEIVHPFRESVFVNGFKPTKANEVIVVDGYQWNQKIIVKMIPSSMLFRLLIGVFTLVLGWILIKEYLLEAKTVKDFYTRLSKRKSL